MNRDQSKKSQRGQALLAVLGSFYLLGLSGCSVMGDKESILPQEGASMKEVYDAHFKHSSLKKASATRSEFAKAGVGDSQLAGFTREADTEITALFPKLPNPSLVLYVFPHLTASGQPVPGYATSFTLYEKTEYALPGESEGRH
ncbi:MAG: TIGR03751 family conjugal transfer lipoprotein [Methyloglobulus sp.]|nr:TIGR03751 family conjugal transfer lipoprotein [Methyloglobulus sp.]